MLQELDSDTMWSDLSPSQQQMANTLLSLLQELEVRSCALLAAEQRSGTASTSCSLHLLQGPVSANSSRQQHGTSAHPAAGGCSGAAGGAGKASGQQAGGETAQLSSKPAGEAIASSVIASMVTSCCTMPCLPTELLARALLLGLMHLSRRPQQPHLLQSIGSCLQDLLKAGRLQLMLWAPADAIPGAPAPCILAGAAAALLQLVGQHMPLQLDIEAVRALAQLPRSMPLHLTTTFFGGGTVWGSSTVALKAHEACMQLLVDLGGRQEQEGGALAAGQGEVRRATVQAVFGSVLVSVACGGCINMLPSSGLPVCWSATSWQTHRLCHACCVKLCMARSIHGLAACMHACSSIQSTLDTTTTFAYPKSRRYNAMSL